MTQEISLFQHTIWLFFFWGGQIESFCYRFLEEIHVTKYYIIDETTEKSS